MKVVSKLLAFGLLMCVLKSSSAQDVFPPEEIFSFGMQLGTGARAIAMGGAYTSVGGDFSASFWNPAALANIRRVEFYGSLSHLMRQNTVEFGVPFDPAINESEENFTKFNSAGLAYPVPTEQGSLVFAFGYNQVKSYDSNFDFRAFNFSPDDSVNQAWKELETGSLNTWTASGAMAVSPNMSVGVGLNFWTGGSDFQTTFREVDIDDIYADFENFTRDDGLNTNISGFNVKIGGLIELPLLRLGATISTPITFKVEEEWSFHEEELFDDGSFVDSLDAGIFEYRIRSPWTFSGGASLNLLNFVFSGDIEYNDWTQIKYKSEPPFSGVTETEANLSIRDNYRATTRIRLGGEFTLPLTGLSFRAGYFRDPSIFKDVSSHEDKQFYSAGIGFLVDKQVRLDVTLVHGFWKNFNQDLPGTDATIDYEDIEVNKAFVSLAFRL
ncbi:outer membrane protein transport protein [candidate division KSB1 bacterium]|nr:outer membrane protein transport protein [candidate division KSB1 bacterium]